MLKISSVVLSLVHKELMQHKTLTATITTKQYKIVFMYFASFF